MSPEEAILYEIKEAPELTYKGATSHQDTSPGGSLDPIHLYKTDVYKHKALSAQEEYSLAVRMARGDTEARDAVIQSSLCFVINIAHQFAGHGLPLEDLIQEGNIGLLNAVDKFRVSRNCRFITYAGWWIRMQMLRAIKTGTSIVNIPIYLHFRIGRVKRIKRIWEAIYGDTPTHVDIIRETGLTSEEINNFPYESKNHIFLDDPAREDFIFNNSEADITEPLEREYRSALITSWLNKLNEKEKAVITLRYGLESDEPMTLEAIGRTMGITRERVRQIEQRAHKKMRVWAEEEQMPVRNLA
ncbi:MAG: RNA polymerase sigma factor RpoD/SigA [Deltaproteobacteria bacterium]